MEESESRFYSNNELIRKICTALFISFNHKKPVMNVNDSYNLNMKFEKNEIKIGLSETNCDQNKEEFKQNDISTINNSPSSTPSATTGISDQTEILILNIKNINAFNHLCGGLEVFGDPENDYWIGFRKLRAILGDRRHVLNLVQTLDDGSECHSRYDDFRLGEAEEGYGIKSLGKYSGNYMDELREYENPSPQAPPWFLSFCTMALDSDRVITSTRMRITAWPGRFY